MTQETSSHMGCVVTGPCAGRLEKDRQLYSISYFILNGFLIFLVCNWMVYAYFNFGISVIKVEYLKKKSQE